MQKRRSLFFLSDLCKQKWLTHHQSNKKKNKKQDWNFLLLDIFFYMHRLTPTLNPELWVFGQKYWDPLEL